MEKVNYQFVEESVTREKFDEELGKYKKLKEHYRISGILLLEEDYPDLYFAFTAPNIVPVPIIFAVKINFDNYDILPLSVKFINPLTFEPLVSGQMLTAFLRKVENSPLPVNLLQAEQDGIPFLCFPGIREYHNHPRHTGDSWLLHRKKGGEGSLCFILENLHLYGITHISSYGLQFNGTLQATNLQIKSDPSKLPL